MCSSDLMPRELKQAVIEHYEWQASFLTDRQRKSDSTPLCCDVHGNAIRPRYMADQFKQLCETAGIELEKGKSFHVLRHTFVSQQVASGVDIKSVQAYVGHASVSTTLDIYAHLMPGHGAAIASMSGISEFGLPSVSIKIALVLSLIAASKEPSTSGSTKVVSIP